LQGTFIGLHIVWNSACSLACSHGAYCWGCQIFMGHLQPLWILLEQCMFLYTTQYLH